MAAAVYLLCALTSLLCTVLLVRGYLRTRSRILMWSALCFAGLTANNVLLVVDRLVVKDVDLSTWRVVPAVAGVAALVFGLIWEER